MITDVCFCVFLITYWSTLVFRQRPKRRSATVEKQRVYNTTLASP